MHLSTFSDEVASREVPSFTGSRARAALLQADVSLRCPNPGNTKVLDIEVSEQYIVVCGTFIFAYKDYLRHCRGEMCGEIGGFLD